MVAALELTAQGNAHVKHGATTPRRARSRRPPRWATAAAWRARRSGSLLSNRAAAPSLRREADAMVDCDAMLEGGGGHLKALHHRGQAHEQLRDHLDLTMKDYTRPLTRWTKAWVSATTR